MKKKSYPMKSKLVKIGSIILILMLALMVSCRPKGEITPAPTTGPKLQGKLVILHAGSLAIPFKDISRAFNEKYPEVKIELEGRGSRATIRQVTELHRKADIIGSADYSLILPMMSPDYADWYIAFACNRMVIAYTTKSKYSDEINKDNWYKILADDPKGKGVTYGHSNPDDDPCGYRTLMMWQLAEKYYRIPGLYKKLLKGNGRVSKGREIVRRKSVDLIALLEAGELDYAFEYLSVAKQHGLKYIELPREIDLSSEEFKELYSSAKVKVSGKKPGEFVILSGKPIIYGLTIPKNAPRPDLAVIWVKFLLGPEGQMIMKKDGQPPLVPALANDLSRLPLELRSLVKKGT